ncbi:histidine-type phosphatase [Chitinophagaceae bacterium LWZ2-11]
MKKWIYLVLLLGISLSLNAQQNPVKEILLGTKTLYTPLQEKYTPAPEGFTPVFINYAGRHGARHLTKPGGSDAAVLKLLKAANKANALTTLGSQLMEKVALLVSIEKENYGNISLSGAKEQTGIGERMVNNYSSVFKGRGLQITTTAEVRTQQSCAAFLKAFPDYNKEAITIKTPLDSDNNELRFYDISPNYTTFEKEGNWKEQYKKLEETLHVNELYPAIAAQFFSPSFTDSLIKGRLVMTDKKGKSVVYNAASFVDDLYSLYTISYSLQGELNAKNIDFASIDLSIFFSSKQLDILDNLNGADDFLKKGPSTCNTCLQVTDAVPLLVDFINTTDAFIKTKNKDAVLRFAHAETIAPFAALLGIKGASEQVNNIIDYRSVWHADKVIPLSANIQMILFEKNKEHYIKLLFNEKEAELPIQSVAKYYYKWDTVKAFYIARLSKMHVSLTDDMHQYLLNLK